MLTKNITHIGDNISNIIQNYNKVVKLVFEEVSSILKESRYVFMENKEVFYDNDVVALYPNLEKYKCGYIAGRIEKELIKSNHEQFLNFENLIWDYPTLYEVKTTFNKNVAYPYKLYNAWIGFEEEEYDGLVCVNNNILYKYNINSSNIYDATSALIPIYRLKCVNSDKISDDKVLKLWLENDLIPKGIVYDKEYKILIQLEKLNVLKLRNNIINIDSDKFVELYEDGKLKIDLVVKIDEIIDGLINCDKIRADIEPYDKKMLFDPNRGHWELWDYKIIEDDIKIKIEEQLIARNPIADVKDGGIVGIDFGTKSTVVVHQENSEYTLPMRVGIGQFRKEINEKHYENPTVIEFINIKKFLDDYKKINGRPNTSWEDITISHTAFNSLLNSKSDDYYAYFSELKQWCGNKKHMFRIKDKQNNVYDLPLFLNSTEESINPVELYAYYLGLYINNMHNGIYLEYVMSFPVTYEKEIREKIIESFKSGLRKSLPNSLTENEDIMKKFKVYQGASEPAAYAISALQQYGFEPEDDEKEFYGVFDFGGGTTDFDFGIWREASGAKERRYDFVVEHFGAGGDRYLGGENLLELLAFEIFKDNASSLREKGITFILPPDCKKFPGSEVLLNESQESKLNTRQLMEKLRPLWEQDEDYENLYERGIIGVNLYEKDGKVHTNFELNIDIEKLKKVLSDRIEMGIRNFFESLRIAFNNPNTTSIKYINIFLAGNSSKSPIVEELFNKYIEMESKDIFKDYKKEKEVFKIYPPLGTEEAYLKQEELGLRVDRDNLKKPTGKTGVAFGLIDSRSGGKIKVINKNLRDDEAKFKYFIGENKRKKFNTIIDTDTEYNKWYEFIDAMENDFEIYYTTLPEAITNKLPIAETSRVKCILDDIYEDEDIFVYLRAVSPTCLEYVVAREDEIEENKFLSNIKLIQLG